MTMWWQKSSTILPCSLFMKQIQIHVPSQSLLSICLHSNICFETLYILLCQNSLLLWECTQVIFIALFEESCSLRANPHSCRVAAAQFHSFKQLCTQYIILFILLKNEWGLSQDLQLFPSILILCCHFLLPASLHLGWVRGKDRQQIILVCMDWPYFVWSN